MTEWPKISEAHSLLDKVERLANATWVRGLVDSDLADFIKKQLESCQLTVERNPYSGNVALLSPGKRNGLKESVLRKLRESDGESYLLTYAAVGPETYAQMASEGVVDWMLHTDDSGYELRGCPQCGKWFEPQLRSRSRFCSDPCRKNFNNLRNSNNEDMKHFMCHGCGETRAMDDFAGLRFIDDDGLSATPLRIEKYANGASDRLCCIHCVRSAHQEWRRYIAPMESLSERASA